MPRSKDGKLASLFLEKAMRLLPFIKFQSLWFTCRRRADCVVVDTIF
jgi:hypothetical protein